MRNPTTEEIRIWTEYKNRVQKRTSPMVQGCTGLLESANRHQFEMQRLVPNAPPIVERSDVALMGRLNKQAYVLQEQIRAALLKKAVVRIEGNTISIYARPNDESLSSLVYPTFEGLGVAPIIIAAAIVGVALLINGDQTVNKLEQETQLEALKLQRQMVKADLYMAQQPKQVQQAWSSFKTQNANNLNKQLKHLGKAKDKGFVEKFLGTGPTMAAVIGGVGLAALVFARKQRG